MPLGGYRGARRLQKAKKGSVTMTIETSTNGATTLSRSNLSGYVGHVTS